MVISTEALNKIVGLIDTVSLSAINVLRYSYFSVEDDFYNVSIKDILKVALNDITNPFCLQNLGIHFNSSEIPEFGDERIAEIKALFKYNIAIHVPFLKVVSKDNVLKDGQLKDIYDVIVQHGGKNINGYIENDFKSMLQLAKGKKPEPFFDNNWFKKWTANTKKLSSLNNRNIYLLGCSDIAFPLFYSSLYEKIASILVGEIPLEKGK